jgi:hypothetical protein
MISAITGASAICCFAASYVAHQILPVKPAEKADMIASQSTSGAFNVLSKEELQRQAKTAKDLVDFYIKKQATLEDVVKVLTHAPDIQHAHQRILETLRTTPRDSDDYGYFELLKKSLEDEYSFLKSEDPQISVSIQRAEPQPVPAQPQAAPSL